MAKNPLTAEFLISRGSCCGKNCMNCPYSPRFEKGATKVEIVKLLDEWIEDVEKGELTLGSSARKCYMNKDHKKQNLTTWIHDDELKKYIVLKGLSKTAERTVQKN